MILPPENHWSTQGAAGLGPLELLAYRSNLLGSDRSVANWDGGNTSCKATEVDFRDRPTRVLCPLRQGRRAGRNAHLRRLVSFRQLRQAATRAQVEALGQQLQPGAAGLLARLPA